MKTFPMFLKVENRRIVIVGGGEQAAQKMRLALKTEAELVLLAPALDAELKDLVDRGRVRWATDEEPDLFVRTALVFIATGCKGADAAWHSRAKSAGALVNVVDYPDLCDAITPSIVDRDPVVIAIGTEGTAPVLGRRIKSKIEESLHPRLGAFAALAGRMRAEVARRIPSDDRREYWHWVFGGMPWQKFSSGNERQATQDLKAAIADRDFSRREGRLSIVSGASAPELVTLGVVERLQSADVIYASDDVPETILELARRDAKRIPFRASGSHPRLQSALTQAVTEAEAAADVVYISGAIGRAALQHTPGLQIDHLSCATPIERAVDDTIRYDGSKVAVISA